MTVADFPSLTPSGRSWTPGAAPMTSFRSMAGYEVRVRHGSLAVGQQLSLAFDNLLEADAKAVTDHYALAYGELETFELPAAVFGGMASYGHIKPSQNQWRYGGPPQVSFVAPGIASVSVTLQAVPV